MNPISRRSGVTMGSSTHNSNSKLSNVANRVGPQLARIRSTMGIQGRVVFCFVGLLLLSMSATVYMFVKHTGQQVGDLIAEQARQMSASMALSNERAVRLGRTEELERISRELIKSRNVLYVGFFDADGKKLALASRDADIDLKNVNEVRSSTSMLMQVHPRRSTLFGEYLETIAPVLGGTPGASKLEGYVAVGVSQDSEEARLKSITYVVVLIAALSVALSILVGVLLVHRIFMPIRQLVGATQKIIGGDLETRVDIERGDTIGQLARSFNEMVVWVKQQQRDLASANFQLSSANRDLEAKVAQRTAQLEAANQRLSTEIADKEEFLRAVSHDLSAPLRNIDGMATVLLSRHRDSLNADVIHRLERIKSNVEMETSLIAELLELSRIRTRRQKTELIDTNQMLIQLREMFEEDLRARSIDLIIETPLPAIEGEKLRLRQVFQNLIDNAIKYIGGRDDRPRRIVVGCNMKLTEAEFFVKDNGIGIHADELDKVFLVFRRGKNSSDVDAAGKGVGLASVKSIIEMYSGRIWVESVLGEGSTFRFTINGRHVPATDMNAGESEDRPVPKRAAA